MTDHSRLDVHQQITDRIVAAIEAGAARFELPWTRAGGSLGRPSNALTRKAYNGVNILALWVASLQAGYGSPLWGTYRQWQELGAQVRRGEKASLVVFYKALAFDAPDGEEESQVPTERAFARASWVFNLAQVEGYTVPQSEIPDRPVFDPITSAEQFVATTGARITEGGDMACYVPSADLIRMPDRARFTGSATMTPAESYYATLMHELVHWTGAEHRLHRDLRNRFGSEAYAMEELVAELGAAFLCSDLGLTPETRPDHAGYIANWLNVLKSDKKAIFTAASKASAAAAYLRSG